MNSYSPVKHIPAFNRAMVEVFSQECQRCDPAANGEQRTTPDAQHNPRHHVEKLKKLLIDVANHAREDVTRVSDPKAQALFETTAEGLKGLAKAFEDYDAKREEAWRTAGSR